jgi:hypothetical protein
MSNEARYKPSASFFRTVRNFSLADTILPLGMSLRIIATGLRFGHQLEECEEGGTRPFGTIRRLMLVASIVLVAAG